MSSVVLSAIFWLVFWTVFYIVARQLDTNDYTREPLDLPAEGNHIYVQQEAYNRYEDQQYNSF